MVIACLLAAQIVGCLNDDRPRLAGGFIQYWEDMKTGGMDEDKWGKVLDAMRDANLCVVIIQWTVKDGVRFVPDHEAFLDSTGIVLKYAQKNDMDVYVGLQEDSSWFARNKWRDTQFLATLSSDCRRLADAVQKRYGKYASFKGWYLSQEMWNENYTDVEIENLGKFFQELGDSCRGLAPPLGRRVAVSPFYNPWVKVGEVGEGFLAAPEFAKTYRRFLDKAHLDIVMLQDSVGAKGVKVGDFTERVVPYYQAFRDVCGQKVDLWGNVESFEIVPNQPDSYNYQPTDIGRFKEQIRVTAPFVENRLVTFDFFHYMNLYGYLHESPQQSIYRAREKILYDAYKSAFVP